MALENYNKLLNSALPHFLKVFPNPAKDYIFLEYQLEPSVQAVIKIQDFKENIIQSFETRNQQDHITILTHDWKPGIYSANLYFKGKAIESSGFTVPELKKGN